MIHRQVKIVVAPPEPAFFFFVKENTSEGNEQVIAHICPELGWLVVLILTWKFHYANEASLTRS